MSTARFVELVNDVFNYTSIVSMWRNKGTQRTMDARRHNHTYHSAYGVGIS